MGHTTTYLLILLTTLAVYVQNGSTCSISGVSNNLVLLNVIDTDREINLFQGTTTGISGVVSASHGGDGVNEGPYFAVALQDDQFVLNLHENFAHYEEYNTAMSMSVVVTFSCTTQANNINVNFIIDITDTNNNAPIFLPSNELTFRVTPPLPPGYLVTGCLNGITVRDIDLTTYRIDFNIEENELFSIDYDEISSQEAKIFGATLRTTAFIRSIPEPITIRISATDVDRTGDDPITTVATIRIEADDDGFTFPEEPIFSQVFYMSSYTTENEVLTPFPIFLQQGYDDSVVFNIDGEYKQYFDLVATGNTVSVLVTSPLPRDVILLGQLLLELSAEREFTSGATATLVVDLPEVLSLVFAELHYEASIVDGILSPVGLSLSQGYENGYEISIINEYSTFFTWTATGAMVTITMSQLNPEIIDQNTYITLQVVATSDSSSASTIVTLEIIKDDTVTPVFEESLYTITYDPETLPLSIGPMILSQGYDASVTFNFESEYEQYGKLVLENNSVYLNMATLPQQVLEDEQHIFFTITAAKPRTVGASTTVAISMPRARELSFAENSYRGQLEGSTLTLGIIVLSYGYSADVTFRLLGDYETYFEPINNLNEVTIDILSPLPEDVILNNNFITLTLEASGSNTVNGITNIALEIIKQDTVTPVFSKVIYDGALQGNNGVEVENIFLSQGFDSTVSFSLGGVHSQYFTWTVDANNNVIVSQQSNIPEEVIFNEKVLLLNIIAEKPLTVGASAVISITFPQELTEPATLRFSEDIYVGTLDNELLTLENIVLEEGYTTKTNFSLTGEFATYFTETNAENIVTIALSTSLPDDVIANNKRITLFLKAERDRAVSASTAIVIDLLSEEVATPVFSGPYYTGTYSVDGGLVLDQPIFLAEGYDETVTFELEGVYSIYFDIQQVENEVKLALKENTPIPEELVRNYSHFLFSIVANKPNLVGVRAAISIDLPDEASTVLLRFAQISYVGRIDMTGFEVEPITLLSEHTDNLAFSIMGEYSDYFTVNQNVDTITLEANDNLPLETILNNDAFIILDVQVTRPESISATTTIVAEVIRAAVEEPVFERTFYAGLYSSEDGLAIEGTIQLVQGYDDTVVFSLDQNETDSQYFSINQVGNRVDLTVKASISEVQGRGHVVTSVIANKPGASAASTTIVISLEASNSTIRFSQVYYSGNIKEGNEITLGDIRIEEGYTPDINILLIGENDNLFRLEHTADQGDGTGVVQIYLDNDLPSNINGRILTLILEARSGTEVAYATIVLELVRSTDEIGVLMFEETHYLGSYSDDGWSFDHQIRLIDDFNADVLFSLNGEYEQYFEIVEDVNNDFVTISLVQTIPQEVIQNNRQLALTMIARSTGYQDGRTAIVISLDQNESTAKILQFQYNNYRGSIYDNATSLELEPIVLSQGYTENVIFSLNEEATALFELIVNGPVVTVIVNQSQQNIISDKIIILELTATSPENVSVHTTIILEVISEENTSGELVFSEAYYSGRITEDSQFIFEDSITLSAGYDETVSFNLEGEHAQWFQWSQIGNLVAITLVETIPAEILATNQQLIFTVTAEKTGSTVARSAIVISLPPLGDDIVLLRFEQTSYLGEVRISSISDDALTLAQIILSQGYSSDVEFSLEGDLKDYFNIQQDGPVLTILQQQSLPEIPVNRLIILELQATAPQAISTYTTILIQIIIEDENNLTTPLTFSEPYYVGQYNDEEYLVFNSRISLNEGYDEDVTFELEGEHEAFFKLEEETRNSFALSLQNPIPSTILENNHQLVLVVTAYKPGGDTARAVIVISLIYDSITIPDASFERALYTGVFELGVVQHEPIKVFGFNGSVIGISGAYSDQFVASATDGSVAVLATSSATLPDDTSHVALELLAGSARTALVLDVSQSDAPTVPTVTFSSPSYEIRSEVSQTGLVGRVQATSDNGEGLIYAVQTDNVHLLERLSVNGEGDLHLSAPANSGIYELSVTATTVTTQVSATATVRMIVEAVTVCGENELVVPPLIVLDRDEEEPHENLVVLDGSQFSGCYYDLTNRWPVNQDWLFVDETGLHARAIDREDASIAFMALSQVQVELILHCNDDDPLTRSKRSLNTRLDWLGPYDYGNNKWTLTDSISYNSRRSLVNLIVNDINDNDPIFVDKEREPIAVGYPMPDLLDTVMPRALAELTATDADIGENAALLYWSSAPQLAVAPSSGAVHVRDNQRELMQEGMTLTIYATDRNGEGNTGSIELVKDCDGRIKLSFNLYDDAPTTNWSLTDACSQETTFMVRLLNAEHIAVLTVRDAFLDDEKTILSNLTSAIGYDVKILSSVVISDEYEDANEIESFRSKRQAQQTGGASLRLYVYGMIQREPVNVNQLTSDINNNIISSVVVDSISLQDYLDSSEVCAGAESARDIGLLVATIVLSVLLFILILFIAAWFFLKWWKSRNYDQFSDENSLTSRNEPVNVVLKPDTLTRPRLNIEDLKRSERRLQEMLQAPVNEVTSAPTSSKNPSDIKIDVPHPDINAPIIIQSIDKLKAAADSDDDEFGEVKKAARRKSVVTFNENVEKIIHVEDPSDDNSDDIEIERL